MEEEMSNFLTSFFRNSMLSFFDDLFSHVLKETEGIESTPRFENVPTLFRLYQDRVGFAIVKILEVSSPHINEFYESVQEKIQDRGNLRTFISRLGEKFLLEGKAADTLYFLAVTSRIFALISKTDVRNSNMYIKECVKALEKTSAGSNALSGFYEILPLIKNILEREDWKGEFRSLNIGDASFYFPTEPEVD